MSVQNRSTLKSFFETGDQPTQSNFEDLIDSLLLVSGDTTTGPIVLNADPTNAMEAATKSYVDNFVAGLSWKQSVIAATTGNITLSGNQTIDGVTVVDNDRVLVKNQSAATENGIYVVNSGAWSRAADNNSGTEIANTTVLCEGGVANAGTQWNCSDSSITLGSTNITFVKIAGAGTYTNGAGLLLSGNVFSIDSSVVTLTGSQTLTNKTLTDPTVNGGTLSALSGLAIRDTSAAFDVTIAATSSSALSAARILTLDLVNAARAIKLGGDLTLASSLITSGANSLTLTTTGVTNVTLPTSGTLLSDAEVPLVSQVRNFRSVLKNGNSTMLLTSGTAYFVYIGYVTKDMVPKYVNFRVSVAGAGTQAAEIGLFSTPAPPNKTNQTLTKLTATGTVDSLTSTGVKGNTSAFNTTVSAGTHLWLGLRVAMATTQPDMGVTGTLGRDYGYGRLLRTASATAFTSGSTYSGVIPSDSDTQCPDLQVSLD